jgi:hypothetical protein
VRAVLGRIGLMLQQQVGRVASGGNREGGLKQGEVNQRHPSHTPIVLRRC